MNPYSVRRSTARGLAMAFTIVLSSCASQPAAITPANEAEACAVLKSVIAAEPSGFEPVKRGAESQHPLGERWEAAELLPRTTCQVWKWGGGRNHYLCLWKKGDEAVARSDFEAGKRMVGNCLGSSWTVADETARNGVLTTYAAPKGGTRASLRFLSNGGGYGGSWQTSLLVGKHLEAFDVAR